MNQFNHILDQYLNIRDEFPVHYFNTREINITFMVNFKRYQYSN